MDYKPGSNYSITMKKQTMKNVFLLVLTLYSAHAFAQTSNAGDVSGKQEISISINTVDPSFLVNTSSDDRGLSGGDKTDKSYAIGITGKLYLNDDIAFRMRFIYTQSNIKEYRDVATGAHTIYDFQSRRILLKFSPGFQWGFSKNKISFFGGLELPVTIIGDEKGKGNYLNEALNGTSRTETSADFNTPGGFSAGLGIFFGSNYFFTNRFGVGFDFATAYQYSSVGGTSSSTSISTGTNGNLTRTLEYKETTKQYKFSAIQGGINLVAKF